MGYPGSRIGCCSVRGHYRPNRTPNPESAGCMRRGCRIGCLSVRGHYRPNRTPGTKRGVGAHVRTARQSRDCLRVRPSRAPPLFVAVRSACGAGTAHRCTRRVGGTSSHPRSARPLAAPSGFASLRQPDRFATGASNRFSRRKLAHPLASVRSMV